MLATYEILLFFSAVLTAVLFNYSWRRKTLRGIKPFAWLLLLVCAWSLNNLYAAATGDLESKILLARSEYLWIALIPACVFVLALTFSPYRSWVRRRLFLILAIEPVLVCLVLWINPIQHLFINDLHLVSNGSFQFIDYRYGPAFLAHEAYSYGLLIISAYLFYFKLAPNLLMRQGQAVILSLGIFPSLAWNFTNEIGFDILPGMNLTPFLITLTSPILALGLFRSRLINILPAAYDKVIEGMSDGVVVLNIQNQVVAMNTAAARIFGKSGTEPEELTARLLFHKWPGLTNCIPSTSEARQEITLNKNGTLQHYEVRVTPLYKQHQQVNGQLVTFQNITARKQAEETLKRRNEELSALHATLLDITASRDLPSLLQTIVERAAHLLHGYGGSLYRCYPETGEVRCVVNYQNPNNRLDSVMHYNQGEAGLVAQSAKPLVIDDYHSWSGENQNSTKPQVMASLSVPMIWQGQVTGVINVVDVVEDRHFTQEDLELLTMLANQATIAVENTRLLEAEHMQHEQSETLRQGTSTLTSSLDRKQVLQTILEQLARVVAYDSASLMLISGDYLDIVSNRGLHAKVQSHVHLEIRTLDHIREVIELRRSVVISDTLTDSRWKQVSGTGYIRSWLGVPLVYKDKTLGVLNLNKEQSGYYKDQDARLALAFANQAAIAIENAQLFEAAQRRAQEAETLRQTTATIAATLSQEEAIDCILEQLSIVVPYDSASVQLLHDRYLEIVGGRGWPENTIGVRFPVPGINPNTIVIQERRSLIVDNPNDVYPAFRETQYNHIQSWLGVPLVVHDQVIGLVSVDSKQKGFYTQDHARLACAFADQVAIAIENARLYSAEKRRVDELDALRATLADISAELELPRLLQAILARAVTLLDAQGAELGLFEQDRQELTIVASYEMGKDYKGIRMTMGEGVMGRVAETCEPLLISDYPHWDGRSPQYQDGTWNSILAVPLLIGGRLVGVIAVVDSDPDRTFGSTELHLLNLLAQQASIAVENARLYQSAREAAERRAILHHASQEVVAASLDSEGIYSAIHNAAARLMPSEAFAITLLDENNSLIDCVYIVDHKGRAPAISIPVDRGISGRVIATGQSLYIEDILEKLDSIDSIRVGDKEEVRSILAVPMRLGEKVVGMLSTQSYIPKAYTDEDLHLLEMLASYAAIALDNTRLFSEVQKLAITDALTGIFNRRQLLEQGHREFTRSLRFERPLSVVFIDIDRFKKVNDTYGHPTGDVVLQELTQRIQMMIREIDILGRYGGEEFVLLLPETDGEAAYQVAERIRKSFENDPFTTDKGKVCITASLGTASLKEDMADFNNLLDQADAAMYHAKEAGRNRVCRA
ncbi:MAG: GAF domain-containing protein [Omnitrophica WOR_2 bacterium]